MTDLVGQKFGVLTVISYIGAAIRSKKREHRWLVECECGRRKELRTSRVKSSVCCMCNRGSEPNTQSMRALYASYRKDARHRGLEFTLTLPQFGELTSGKCSYCGIEPSRLFIKDKGRKLPADGGYLFNGIDRTDNSIGYIYENCTTACTECNMSKHARDQQSFLDWIHRIAQFQGYKKAGE